MPLNKEIWLEALIGNLFGTTAAITRSIDHSPFIDNRTVHVPNAGAPGKIAKNVTNLPLSISSREDLDLTYRINDYKIYPMLVTNLEQAELSYDKRTSIIAENRAKLYEEVALDIIASWVSGANPVAKASLTVREMIVAAAKQFAKDKVPTQGRTVMLTADGYYSFLDSLSSQEQFAFSASADAAKGTLGSFMGFEVSNEFLLPSGVEMLAWHPIAVSRALGDVTLLSSEQDPVYYGDILSGEMRAGGAVVRKDGKGIFVVDADGVADAAPNETIEDMTADD